MSDLKFIDQQKFEKLFDMHTGYVLDFSNRTFREFIIQETGKDIYEEKYYGFSGSKASRLRAFWEKETNFLVAKLNEALLNYWKFLQQENLGDEENKLYEDCSKAIASLRDDSLSEHIEVIQADDTDVDFSILARSIRESIEKNEPEAALDRLHTYVVKYIRNLCTKHETTFNKEDPLHSLFGKYYKSLKDRDLIDSEMTERILKSAISLLDSFNKVRNDQSFAHDNPILNYKESMLIFKNVSSVIEFLESIEEKSNSKKDSEIKNDKLNDLPF